MTPARDSPTQPQGPFVDKLYQERKRSRRAQVRQRTFVRLVERRKENPGPPSTDYGLRTIPRLLDTESLPPHPSTRPAHHPLLSTSTSGPNCSPLPGPSPFPSFSAILRTANYHLTRTIHPTSPTLRAIPPSTEVVLLPWSRSPPSRVSPLFTRGATVFTTFVLGN